MLVVAISHAGKAVVYEPSVVVDGSVHYPIVFEAPATQEPPASYHAGALVSVAGKLTMKGVHVADWTEVALQPSPVPLGALTSRLKNMKVLYFHLVGGEDCNISQSLKVTKRRLRAGGLVWHVCLRL